jgi:hypothetical protein
MAGAVNTDEKWSAQKHIFDFSILINSKPRIDTNDHEKILTADTRRLAQTKAPVFAIVIVRIWM